MSDLDTVEVEAGSTEYVEAEIVIADRDTGATSTATTYDVSLMQDDAQPDEADWHAAPWLTTFTRGDYLVRVRFTDTPEIPIRRAYRVHVR